MLSRLRVGLKSLKGALILLLFTIWSVAVLLAITVGTDQTERFHGFSEQRDLLFSDAFRAAFTVFRCVTGDCVSTKGEPLAALMANSYGWIFAVPYIACICVVTLGILNLIMAVFVERTLEARERV